MWGTGKKRSRLGKWLDRNRFKQEDLIRLSKVNRNTVSKLCSNEDYMPSGTTMQKIIKALKKVDPSVRADKFWDV
jgi:predicted XRE-type DNA-binding protein